MIDLSEFRPCETPGKTSLPGQYVQLHPMDWDRHGMELFEGLSASRNPDLWRYLPFGPFETYEAFQAIMHIAASTRQWETMTICALDSGKALGTASFMRLRQNVGSCEVGCIIFSDDLKQTRAATEAMYLMARHAFDDLGYRRYEWKCNNHNAPSKRAALRYGFEYEGVFRNDLIVKGKNRDTAWFSITDADWPRVKRGFELWLSAENFDANSHQIRSLADLRDDV